MLKQHRLIHNICWDCSPFSSYLQHECFWILSVFARLLWKHFYL